MNASPDSPQITQFFESIESSNISKPFSSSSNDELISRYQYLQTKTSQIDQEIHNIEKSVKMLTHSLESLEIESSSCKYHADAALVSVQSSSSVTIKSFDLSKVLFFFLSILQSISNWIFAINKKK